MDELNDRLKEEKDSKEDLKDALKVLGRPDLMGFVNDALEEKDVDESVKVSSTVN